MKGISHLIMAIIFLALSLFNGILFAETFVIISFIAQIICFTVSMLEIYKWKKKNS